MHLPRCLVISQNKAFFSACAELTSNLVTLEGPFSIEECLSKHQCPEPAILLIDGNALEILSTGMEELQSHFPHGMPVCCAIENEVGRVSKRSPSEIDFWFVFGASKEANLLHFKNLLKFFELRQLVARLESLASTDSLTGLKNRRYFADRLESELERAKRHNRPLSFMMMDIDSFKRVNDIQGHQIGDEVLRQISQILLEHLRSTDLMARMGGDEFAAIMTDTDPAGCKVAADRLRKLVESDREAKSFGISISIGVASFPSNGDNPVALIRSADMALLSAKKQGKNRTVIAPAGVQLETGDL